MSDEEYKAFSYGLDHHVRTPCSHNAVETEFELFYQNISSSLSHIPENELAQLKSKLRNKCHKYNNNKNSYKYQHIIANLPNNKTIKVLKQDNGRGVVIMDSSKCMEKCLGLLENNRLAKTNDDRTKRIESQIQRYGRNLKSKITKEEY